MVALLLAAPAPAWAGAPAARLQIAAVLMSPADARVSLVADLAPAAGPPPAFSVTVGGAGVTARAVPVMSGQLAVAVVADASAGAATQGPAAGGAADFLLGLPAGARAAVVADTTPPLVAARLAPGAAEAVRALSTLGAAGRRSTAEALGLALGELRAAPDRPRLVLLHTAAPDAGGEPATGLAARLAAARTLLAVVTPGPPSPYWSQVGAATGGVVASARPAGVLAAFGRVATALRSRHLVTIPMPERLPVVVSVQARAGAGRVAAEAVVQAPPGLPLATPAESGGDGAGSLGTVGLVAALALGAVGLAVLLVRRPAVPRPARPPSPRRLWSPGGPAPPPVRTRPLLARDEVTYAELDDQVGRAATTVDEGRLGRVPAAAEIALAARGRVDLLDRLADTERRFADSSLSAWRPSDTVLDLLAGARRMATGTGVLAGPAGVRVEHALRTGPDGTSHSVLRLTRDGHPVCECGSVAELARHVDPATLTEAAG